ncbi:MAG TPA: (d)CMP kinase [Gammaproteobacteria bacterium]
MRVTRDDIPVITIDGPSGSGKGTISRILARRLGWHFLDSGALYRLVALAAFRHSVPMDDECVLEKLALGLDARFVEDRDGIETCIYLEGMEVTDEIRGEACSLASSQISVFPAVRRALLEKQRAFRQGPGLVADGRDMGTVVFAKANLKIFLTASQQERANRRYKQLKDKGMDVNLNTLFNEIVARDARDSSRVASPLKPASDAVVLDTTKLTIDEVVGYIMQRWQAVDG